MRALVIIIPIVAFMVFVGVNQYMPASANQSDQVTAAADKEAALPQDAKPSGPNLIIAWFKEKFGGKSSSGGSNADKGYGFQYGDCSKVGLAKRCRTKS